MNTPDTVIRLATDGDIEAISWIYSRIHDAEENRNADIGWTRNIYPTRDTALQALTRGDLYVMQRADGACPDMISPDDIRQDVTTLS